MSRKKSLKEIETNDNLRSITLGDDYVWPILRIRINEEMRKNQGLKSRTFNLRKADPLKIVKTLFYGMYELFRIGKYDYWTFSSSERRKELKGIFVDRVAEPLLTELTNSLMIESPFPLGSHYPKRYLNPINIISRSFFFAAIAFVEVFVSKKITIKNESLLIRLLQENEISIDYRAILRNYRAQYRFMKFLLRFARPKAVFFVFASLSMGFIKALKERGIPVIELQHGIINSSHNSYNVPVDFGNSLFPDYLFTYGQIELELFNGGNYFIDRQKVYPTGYYFLDAYRNMPAKQSYRERLMEKYTKIIVFSLQDPFESYAFEFLRLTAALGTELFFVLVPRDITKDYSDLVLGENVIIEKNLNIYECLTVADFHCTINSTCAIEALFFGVPNILYDYEHWASDYYGTILDDSKNTVFVDSPVRFIDRVAKHEFYGRDQIRETAKPFFEGGFIENFKGALENIFKEHYG